MSHGGKGDTPRPYSVDHKTFESNWEATFGKKNKQSTEDPAVKEQQENLPKDSEQDG